MTELLAYLTGVATGGMVTAWALSLVTLLRATGTDQ